MSRGKTHEMYHGKTVLVTGGTGSFGNAFIRTLLDKNSPARVIVFSRDELKQTEMRNKFNDPRLEFVIGDVRDRNKVILALRGVDYVFHAAALKQVPSCEFFPMEAVKTNILGASNLLEAADIHEVRKVVVLSTDKAVYPINVMGMTKALMEKLVMAYAKNPSARTICSVVRYGNVMCSRGSVIPHFISLIKQGLPLTLTNPHMTRFLLPLEQAVDLVSVAMTQGQPGDTFVRKAPACTMDVLAQALVELFEADNKIETIGVREGEKIHEVLVTSEEFQRADDIGDYFCIRSRLNRDYAEYFSKGVNINEGIQPYTSENTTRLTLEDTKELLLSLSEVRQELGAREKARV